MTDGISTTLRGQFLMAMPGLADPNFSRTVTCICEHTQDGALGIVVNRIHTDLTAGRIFEELNVEFVEKAAKVPIYAGGPVHVDELFILHGPPFDWKGSLRVTHDLAMSNSRDLLEAIAKEEGPNSFLLALGCAGWGPGQLEAEVVQNAWLTGQIKESIVFDTPIDERWEEAVRYIGIDPAILSNFAGHA